MSKRDRMRRRSMMAAIVLKQAFLREIDRALESDPAGRYWVRSNLTPEPILIEKAGTIH